MSVLLFGPQELAAQIAKVAPLVPPGHSNAIVGGVDETGVQAVIMVKRNLKTGTLTASAIARHTWAGDNAAGGSLIYSWP